MFAGSASANQADFVDIDVVATWLNAGDMVEGNFNIIVGEGDDYSGGLNTPNMVDVDGFELGIDEISSAKIDFLIYDLDFNPEAIVLDVTGMMDPETITTEIFLVSLLTIDVDIYVLASLNATGELEWSITADPNAGPGNNFYVALSRLQAFEDSPTTSGGPGPGSHMPEPGSTALLAVGTLVVARAGRSRRR